MFDKLDGILERYDEIMEQLNDPNVVSDQNNFRKLMKEQSDLAPIVDLICAACSFSERRLIKLIKKLSRQLKIVS